MINLTEIIAILLDSWINYLRQHPKFRRVIIGLNIIFLGICIGWWAIGSYYGFFQNVTNRDISLILLIVLISFLIISLISYTQYKIVLDDTRIELQALFEERKGIHKRLIENQEGDGNKEKDMFDVVKLSLNQITEYYTINKSQARSSFFYSIFAIIVGFITLIGGIWLFYFSPGNRNIDLAIISGVSGVVIEFIGGAYFVMYNKSLVQLNYFFNQLVKMQDIMLSIKLCESLEEPKCSEIKEKIIIALLNRSSLDVKSPID